MSTSPKKRIRSIAFGIAATACLLVPVTVSPGQGLEPNNACADGTCCRELNSVCSGEGETMLHHYQTLGGCTNLRTN